MVAQIPRQEGEDLSEAREGLQPEDWIRAGVIVAVALVLSRVVQVVATRFVRNDEATAAAARFVGRCSAFVVVIVGIVYALGALNVRLGPLLGALGIGGLALAFGAQSTLENYFSSLLLETRRPFRISDLVVIANTETSKSR